MVAKRLTPRQARFVKEYLVDCNGTQAATRAGFSPRTANEQAVRLLANISVAGAIEKSQQKLLAKLDVTAERVVQEFARIGFADMRRFATWGPAGVTLKSSDELSSDDAACIAEVSETTGEKSNSIRFKLHDKVASLTKLGERLGLFKGQSSLSNNIQININVTAQPLELDTIPER